jgi:hypothetical protein
MSGSGTSGAMSETVSGDIGVDRDRDIGVDVRPGK